MSKFELFECLAHLIFKENITARNAKLKLWILRFFHTIYSAKLSAAFNTFSKEEY